MTLEPHDIDEDYGDDETLGTRVMRGIITGMAVSIPVAILLVGGFLVLTTGRDIIDSLVAALLPGVLTGFFAGGFIGVVRAMR